MDKERILNIVGSLLVSELKKDIDAIVRAYSKIDGIYITLTESPYIKASISYLGLNYYDFKISKGYLIRMAIILSIFDDFISRDENCSKIFVFDTHHPFEKILYIEDNSVEWIFKANKTLIPLFMDIYEESEQWNKINGMLSSGKFEIGLEDYDNEFKIIGSIPDDINSSVRQMLLIWFRFVLYHEIAHLVNNHKAFTSSWHYKDIPEISTVGSNINSFKCKAIEVDADVFSFRLLLDFYGKYHACDDSIEYIKNIYTVIALGVSCFDLDRRSIFDYFGLNNIYPLPEIRFLLMHNINSNLFSKEKSLLFNEAYVKVVENIVMFFQSLGLAGGAFFSIAGKLSSLDNQLCKEMFIVSSIKDEINLIREQLFILQKYINHYTSIDVYNFFKTDWNYIPYGETEITFNNMIVEWLKKGFNNEHSMNTEKRIFFEPDPKTILHNNIIEKSKLTKRGDVIFIYQSPCSGVMDQNFNISSEGFWLMFTSS